MESANAQKSLERAEGSESRLSLFVKSLSRVLNLVVKLFVKLLFSSLLVNASTTSLVSCMLNKVPSVDRSSNVRSFSSVLIFSLVASSSHIA